jgi:hypothetical protein
VSIFGKNYMARIGAMSLMQWRWFHPISITLIFRPSWIHFGSVVHLASFIIIQQMKGYNPQHTNCNFFFFLSQSPLSEYNIHNNTHMQYNFLIREGFLLRKKTLK